MRRPVVNSVGGRRHKVRSRRGDQKYFSRTGDGVHHINLHEMVHRGGIRL